jgi:hypothetical protein
LRYLTPILALLAFLAVGLNFLLDFQRERLRPVGGGLAASPSLPSKLAAETLRFPIEGVADSVYLVVVEGLKEQQRYGTATAFLVDEKCGIFATNAHVAETVSPDTRVVLRQPGTDVELEVTAAKIHPAYLRMREIFDETGPILEFRRTKKGKEFDNSVPNLQFDFALLYVQTNPGQQDCKLPNGVALPRALKLAPPETLNAAKAGDTIAVIGYPGAGNFSAALAPLAALPRVDFGTIRATGSAVPPSAAGPVQRTIMDTVIFHSAATIGGSSGSPVVNASGEVVAVHARGIASTGLGRSYQEGAAEGVEALRLMLDGKADAALPQYAAAVQSRLKGYVPIAAYARSSAIEAVKATAKSYGMQETVGESSLAQIQFGAEAAEGCLTPSANCLLAQTFSPDFRSGRFAALEFKIDTTRTNMIGVVDFDQEVDLTSQSAAVKKKFEDQRGITFMCPAMILQLAEQKKLGTYAVVRESALETFPSILIPAAHAGTQPVKLMVFRPPFCSKTFTRAQAVLTPFELKPGPRKDEHVSMLDRLSGALADAVNTAGDAVLPANWRDEDGGANR